MRTKFLLPFFASIVAFAQTTATTIKVSPTATRSSPGSIIFERSSDSVGVASLWLSAAGVISVGDGGQNANGSLSMAGLTTWTLQVDTAETILPGASLQNLRTSSTSVQQEQWCLTGGTCDPTAVGGWTLGTDGSNRMVIQAGQGGSVVLDVLHVDASGNLTVPAVLNGSGLDITGTALIGSGGVLVAQGTVRFSGLTAGSGTLTPLCLGSLNDVYTCPGYSLPDITDTSGTVSITGSGGLTITSGSVAALDLPTGGFTVANGTVLGLLYAQTINSLNGYQVNGTGIIDASQDLTLTGSATVASLSTTGGITSGANISASAGYFNCASSCPGYKIGGTTVIDASRDLVNIANISATGNVGIGTGSPGGNLDVDGRSRAGNQQSWYRAQNGNSSYIDFGTDSGGYVEFDAASNGDLALNFNGGAGDVLYAARSGAVNNTLVLNSGNATVYGNLTAGGYIAPVGGVQMARASSTSLSTPLQFCLTGACNVDLVGGWTIGPNASNQMMIQAGQGSSMLNVLQVDASGNLTVPAVLTSVGVSSSGTIVTSSGNLVTTTGLVRSSASGGGFQIGSSTVIDGSLNYYGAAATFTGLVTGGSFYSTSSATFGSLGTTGGITSGANISASAGYFNCASSCPGYDIGGTTVIGVSGGLTYGIFTGVFQAASGSVTSSASNALSVPNGGISVGSGGGSFAGSVTLSAGSLSVSAGSFSSYLNISTNSGIFVVQGHTGQSCSGSPSSSFASVGGIVTHC